MPCANRFGPARRADLGPLIRKNHAPGYGGRPAPKLSIDEIGNAPQKQTERRGAGHSVRDLQQRGTIADLQGQIKDLQVEKDMLESLAARRSKSNRALKEASAEAQEQVELR